MEPDVQSFGVAKLGNQSGEYEDATCTSSEGRRFAVADGATQTSFADRWSQILALEYIMNPPAEAPAVQRWSDWLHPLQEAWSAGIPWDRLPWFATEKARAGACTTLLAVEFFQPGGSEPDGKQPLWRRMLGAPVLPPLQWKAEAIGDTCLFQIREDRLVCSFPLQQPSEFNHSPILITTNPGQNRLVCEHLRNIRGDCRGGDLFLLMTDALAKWFLQRVVVGEKPWRRLDDLADEDAFREFVFAEREAGRMENDDTTLMRVRWPETGGVS